MPLTAAASASAAQLLLACQQRTAADADADAAAAEGVLRVSLLRNALLSDLHRRQSPGVGLRAGQQSRSPEHRAVRRSRCPPVTWASETAFAGSSVIGGMHCSNGALGRRESSARRAGGLQGRSYAQGLA